MRPPSPVLGDPTGELEPLSQITGAVQTPFGTVGVDQVREALELQPLLAIRAGEALRAGALARRLQLDEAAEEPVDRDADVWARAEALNLRLRSRLDVASEEGPAALDELDDGRLELVLGLGANRGVEVDLDPRRERPGDGQEDRIHGAPPCATAAIEAYQRRDHQA